MEYRVKKYYLFLLIGAICMINIACGNTFKYAKYLSKDQELNIAMDYISDWQYREYRGDYGTYTSVLFFEDKKGDILKAQIAVTVKNRAKISITPLTVEALGEDIIAKRMEFADAKLLSKSKFRLLGVKALSIELSYRTLDKIYSTDAKLIPARERIIILIKNDKFYMLTYKNSASEFDKFSKAFNHIIKTLKFKDNN